MCGPKRNTSVDGNHFFDDGEFLVWIRRRRERRDAECFLTRRFVVGLGRELNVGERSDGSHVVI